LGAGILGDSVTKKNDQHGQAPIGAIGDHPIQNIPLAAFTLLPILAKLMLLDDKDGHRNTIDSLPLSSQR
jgi:hypothetical protein